MLLVLLVLVITRSPLPQVTDAGKYVVNAHFEVPVGDEMRSLDVTASTTVNVNRESTYVYLKHLFT